MHTIKRILLIKDDPGKSFQLPRARQHYLPGYTWQITHRWHKQEFLLKFAKVTLSDDNSYFWNVFPLI